MKSLKMKLFSAIVAATILLCCLPALNGCKDEIKDNGNAVAVDSTPKKKIAFTFDDGPQAPVENIAEYTYSPTTHILDKLEQLGMKATFFVVGSRAKTYESTLRRASALGCEIGSHTYNHNSDRDNPNNNEAFSYEISDDRIKSILNNTSSAITTAGVPAPKLFRPIGGSINEGQLALVSSMGYNTIGWSIDTLDWDGRPKNSAKYSDDPTVKQAYEDFVNQKVELIVGSAAEGSIILMHDIYNSSADIFIRASDRLVAEGYELVTVSELLEFNGSAAKPVMYMSKSSSRTNMP